MNPTNRQLVELLSGNARGWVFFGARGWALSPAWEIWHREELQDAVSDLHLDATLEEQ